jgi:hypothetical protein
LQPLPFCIDVLPCSCPRLYAGSCARSLLKRAEIKLTPSAGFDLLNSGHFAGFDFQSDTGQPQFGRPIPLGPLPDMHTAPNSGPCWRIVDPYCLSLAAPERHDPLRCLHNRRRQRCRIKRLYSLRAHPSTLPLLQTMAGTA